MPIRISVPVCGVVSWKLWKNLSDRSITLADSLITRQAASSLLKSSLNENPSAVQNRFDFSTSLTGRFGKIMVIKSEEHTSELQSLMRISYAVFCLKKKINKVHRHNTY